MAWEIRVESSRESASRAALRPTTAGRDPSRQPRDRGFTLVELLVVIAIIGVLVALLLPAVQAARGAARRTECRNHLKQIALACLEHVDAVGSYPSAGWHWAWAGDPDLGLGPKQPGAWTYSVLPFVEEQAVFDLGGDGNPNQITAEQRRGARERLVTPLSVFHCPSRRAPAAYPSWATFGEPGSEPANSLPVTDDQIAKTDYAINGGSDSIPCPWAEPPHNAAMSDDWTPQNCRIETTRGNGIGHFKSEVRTGQITDGSTHTFLIGEKFLEPARYETTAHGDHHGMYVLYWDTFRHSGGEDGEREFWLPLQDANLGNIDIVRDVNSCCTSRFGGPHPGAFHMAMCDGSVQSVTFSLDPLVYEYLGNRQDGKALEESPF